MKIARKHVLNQILRHWRRQFLFVVVLSAGCLASFLPQAYAQSSTDAEREQIGRLRISDFELETSFNWKEPGNGSFALGESAITAEWLRDDVLSGVLAVGTKDLLGVPARFESERSTEIAIVEVYAQAVTQLYGSFRLGLVPIPFGLEAGEDETLLRLPDSLLLQQRMVVRRDIGVHYHIANSGFFSDVAVHNGEGGEDLDNQTWLSVRFGWAGGRGFKAGLSGVTGRTTPQSTNPDPVNPRDSATAGIVVDQPSRFRAANVFFDFQRKPVTVELEVTAGETRQDAGLRDFRHGRIDFGYESSSSIEWLARYDTFDPQTSESGDRIEEVTLGLAWKSRYETSVLYLLGTKTMQEDVSPGVHRFQVIWELTPSVGEG